MPMGCPEGLMTTTMAPLRVLRLKGARWRHTAQRLDLGTDRLLLGRAQDQASNIDNNKAERSVSPSFKTDVLPIFTSNCAGAGWHSDRNLQENRHLSGANAAHSGVAR